MAFQPYNKDLRECPGFFGCNTPFRARCRWFSKAAFSALSCSPGTAGVPWAEVPWNPPFWFSFWLLSLVSAVYRLQFFLPCRCPWTPLLVSPLVVCFKWRAQKWWRLAIWGPGWPADPLCGPCAGWWLGPNLCVPWFQGLTDASCTFRGKLQPYKSSAVNLVCDRPCSGQRVCMCWCTKLEILFIGQMITSGKISNLHL